MLALPAGEEKASWTFAFPRSRYSPPGIGLRLSTHVCIKKNVFGKDYLWKIVAAGVCSFCIAKICMHAMPQMAYVLVCMQ
jgi:hypothetical protein